MADTLQKLHRDLLLASSPNCDVFAARVNDISVTWGRMRENILKNQGRIKMLNAEIQKLKRQLAKQKKMNFGSSADHKPHMAPTVADEQKAEELILQPIPDEEEYVDREAMDEQAFVPNQVQPE